MYDTMTGFLHTTTRCFANVQCIELFYTDSQASIQLADSDQRILLDEDETRIIRRWAELALQATIADNEDLVVRRRCELLEQQQRAHKLNRQHRRKSRPPAIRKATSGPVVDIKEASRKRLNEHRADAPNASSITDLPKGENNAQNNQSKITRTAAGGETGNQNAASPRSSHPRSFERTRECSTRQPLRQDPPGTVRPHVDTRQQGRSQLHR